MVSKNKYLGCNINKIGKYRKIIGGKHMGGFPFFNNRFDGNGGCGFGGFDGFNGCGFGGFGGFDGFKGCGFGGFGGFDGFKGCGLGGRFDCNDGFKGRGRGCGRFGDRY
jgi:hypothetical protein